MHSYKSVLYWENPALTAGVFVPPLVVLISLSYCSMISVVAWSSLTVLFTVLGMKLFSMAMDTLGKPNPLGDPISQMSSVEMKIPEECITGTFVKVVEHLNFFLSSFKSAILMENILDTIKFAMTSYTLTYIGAWFNALTLITMAWIAAFLAPKIYLNNQAVIDEMRGKWKVQLDMLKTRVEGLMGAKPEEKQE